MKVEEVGSWEDVVKAIESVVAGAEFSVASFGVLPGYGFTLFPQSFLRVGEGVFWKKLDVLIERLVFAWLENLVHGTFALQEAVEGWEEELRSYLERRRKRRVNVEGIRFNNWERVKKEVFEHHFNILKKYREQLRKDLPNLINIEIKGNEAVIKIDPNYSWQYPSTFLSRAEVLRFTVDYYVDCLVYVVKVLVWGAGLEGYDFWDNVVFRIDVDVTASEGRVRVDMVSNSFSRLSG